LDVLNTIAHKDKAFSYARIMICVRERVL